MGTYWHDQRQWIRLADRPERGADGRRPVGFSTAGANGERLGTGWGRRDHWRRRVYRRHAPFPLARAGLRAGCAAEAKGLSIPFVY